jgi:hypothetical protein
MDYRKPLAFVKVLIKEQKDRSETDSDFRDNNDG